MLRATSAAPRRRASNDDCWRSSVPTSARSALFSTGQLIAPGMWSSANSRFAAHIDDACRTRPGRAAPRRPRRRRDPASPGLRRRAEPAGDAGAARRCRACGPARFSFGWIRSGWNHSSDSAKPFSRNGTSGTRSSRDSSENVCEELLGVVPSVVRRHAHADQQHRGAGGLARLDHRGEVVPHRRERQAAQPVIGAEFEHHDGRPVLAKQCGQTSTSTARGFAADARVHDRIIQAILAQPLREQLHPAGCRAAIRIRPKGCLPAPVSPDAKPCRTARRAAACARADSREAARTRRAALQPRRAGLCEG